MIDLPDIFQEYPDAVVDRFKKFHATNPSIYLEFESLADQMKERGRKKYSARTIMEVLRWHKDLKSKGDVFEINNDFTPLYIRLLLYFRPEFMGFFELRRVRSKGIKSEEQQQREKSD